MDMVVDAAQDRQDGLRLLIESAAGIASRTGDLKPVRALRHTSPGIDRTRLAAVGAMGWLGVRVPETQGGAGLGVAEYAALAQEIGAALLPEPIIEAVLAIELMGSQAPEAALAGELLILPAWKSESDGLSFANDIVARDGRITGQRSFIPMGAAADAFLVVAADACYLVDARAEGVQVRIVSTVDGGHLATLDLHGAIAKTLPAPDPLLLDVAAIATAASLVGLMERAFSMTLDYLKTRVQFDQPIGHFQALQHRSVDLAIALGVSKATLAEAIQALDAGDDARANVSRAKARIADAALLLTREAIQLHGAIGYTDEADIGLFLRRAMVLAPRYGSAAFHRARFAAFRSADSASTHPDEEGSAVPSVAPGEDLNPLDDRQFRAVIRHWIRTNYPPALRSPPKRLHAAAAMPWYSLLAQQGWLCPAWPRAHGGMGLSPAKLLIMFEEMERYGCARLPDTGIAMVGPLLIAHGNEAQRAFHLPRILSGEIIWCQGYSEPNAGSDLASLRTSAVRNGDAWVLNGQKTWTTLGMDASWIFVLARTDTTAPKQRGISFFLVPMTAKGVSVRPIVNLDSHDEFAEVFFDDVRIPAESIVGEVNAGWTMAKNLLGFERLSLGSPKQAESALDHLERLADFLGRRTALHSTIEALRMELEDHKSFYAVFADQLRRGETLGADISMLKLNQTALYQKISDVLLQVSGDFAGIGETLPGSHALSPASVFLQARPVTIYGGSSEIQRNIVAKQVLSLGR